MWWRKKKNDIWRLKSNWKQLEILDVFLLLWSKLWSNNCINISIKKHKPHKRSVYGVLYVARPNNLDIYAPKALSSQKGGSDSETSRTRLQVSSWACLFAKKGGMTEHMTDFFHEKNRNEAKSIPTWVQGRDLNPRPPGYEPDELPNCSTLRYLIGAGDRDRTGTGLKSHRILSPGRLPVPPLRRASLGQRLR